MTTNSVLAMAIAMFILAAVPGQSVLTIVARSLTYGFRSTLPIIAGVVLGDAIFVVFSFFGLSIVITMLGDLFVIIKLFGAVYLFYLGFKLIKEKPRIEKDKVLPETKNYANFLLGLVLALSNPKVILFYISFFPTIIDMSGISVSDLMYILAIIETALLSVLLLYSYCSELIRGLLKSERSIKILNICSGSDSLSLFIMPAREEKPCSIL